MNPAAPSPVAAIRGERALSTKIERLLGAGVIALLASTGLASAQTIHILYNTPASSTAAVPFPLLNLGTAGSAGFVGSSTLTVGSGLPAVTGTEITNIAFSGTSTPSGVYAGTPANASTPFGPSTNLTKYLVADSNGSVTVTYSKAQDAIELLWGSLDNSSTQNFITIGSTTITGAQIVAAGGISGDDVTVKITGLSLFTSAKFSDTTGNPAFEFLVGQPAPEPATLTLLGSAVAGIGIIRRRRGAQKSA